MFTFDTFLHWYLVPAIFSLGCTIYLFASIKDKKPVVLADDKAYLVALSFLSWVPLLNLVYTVGLIIIFLYVLAETIKEVLKEDE